MKDGIISETKNSRLVKADLPATYDEFKTLASNSGVPIDLLFNALGWSQIPDFLNKSNLLQDKTCDLLGISHSSTVNDAFLSLILPSGKFAVKTTVLSPGGRQMSGIKVQGITTLSGDEVFTNANGTALGFVVGQSKTITAVNDRVDLSGDASVTPSLSSGVVNEIEIKFSRGSITQKTFDSSTKIKFSPDVDEFDCSAIGGGQNGFPGAYSNGGNGGNAGAVANKANIKNTEQEIIVTVGGVGGTSSVGDVLTAPGGAGARGGYGGTRFAGESGKDTTGFLYPQSEVGGSGGGGSGSYDGYGGEGGKPGGGTGGAIGLSQSNLDATKPGAGGGGGAYGGKPGPGNGKPGLVGIMWRYKA